MKKIVLLFVLLLSLDFCFSQNLSEFDVANFKPTYSLAFPEGWEVERFAIPIEFAPSIKYRGIEDIRFAPGWADVKSNEYWSYAFLWYLDGKKELDAATIESNLKAYYNGLVSKNIDQRKISKDKFIPVSASFQEIKRERGDVKTFQGEIKMLDYMEQKPITLLCVVHQKTCLGQSNRSYFFYQLSPQPITSKIWKDLNQLWLTFDCKKK